jgi:hypothetical protein
VARKKTVKDVFKNKNSGILGASTAVCTAQERVDIYE